MFAASSLIRKGEIYHHLFNKYVSRAGDVTGIIPGTSLNETEKQKQTKKHTCPYEAYVPVEGGRQLTTKDSKINDSHT